MVYNGLTLIIIFRYGEKNLTLSLIRFVRELRLTTIYRESYIILNFILRLTVLKR